MHSVSEHSNYRNWLYVSSLANEANAQSKKDFEVARLGVFAIPGPLLTHVNCGIRDYGYGPNKHRADVIFLCV
jgi:hypothetical protein